MLTKQDKEAIRALMQSPQWPAVERLADMLCIKIKADDPVREGEWDTLKNVLSQSGKVEGIRQFIQELYNQAIPKNE